MRKEISPAIDIARKLIEPGCKVKVHDPVALEKFQQEYPNLGAICCESAEEVADDVDARMRSRIVLDGRNALDRLRLARFGFRYIGIAG